MQDSKKDCNIKKQRQPDNQRVVTHHSNQNKSQNYYNDGYEQYSYDQSGHKKASRNQYKNNRRNDSYIETENSEVQSPILKKDQGYRRRSDAPQNQSRNPYQDYFQGGGSKQSYENQYNLDRSKLQNNNQSDRDPSYCQFLDLTLFKVHPCTIDSNNHNLKRCPYYHDQKKDQRRPLGSYQSEMCSYAASGKECPNGESCQKSHNRVEEFYHPDKYKAKFCSSYIDDSGECEYGEYCSFAHSQAEISVELIDSFDKDSDFYMFHFKTVWCPYNETNHQRDLCVYSHNWQDFRRKPQLYNYSKDQCNKWGSRSFINNYRDGCSNEYNCLQSHGWKEQEYHPENYKLNPCKHGDQCNKIHCSYYHSEKDRRQPLQQWFKVFPKTRLVNFPSNYYMPFLRNLTYDRDFMGGIKQTSFSRTTTDISFQNNINQANSDSTKNSQKSLQLTPQSENQSKQPPQQTPPQITINTQAQQNFNLNAPQFVPNQNAPIQITQAQQNSQKRQSLVPNASNFLQLVNLQDIAAQKRMSTSPIIYQGPYNQQNLYQITDNYGQTSQFMMSSNISQTQPTNMSPDMISLSTINPQSSQNASVEQFKKRYSMQPHPMNPMQFDHQNNKRYSAMYPNPILHPSILAAYNQEQQQIEEMKRLSLQTSTNQQLEMFLGHQYLNLPRGDEYMNYDYQSRVEPRSPDINIHKDIYKNINSEPKKKSLQIFEGLHQTMEKQEEQPGQESSSKSDPDEEDNDSDIDNIKYEEGDGSNPDDRAIDCSTIFSNIGLDLKQLDLSGNLSLAKLEGMCYEELRAMVVDEDKTMKLVNELNKLRRKRDEKWIQNLVDFHN